jgi:hypothetical protein
MPAPSYGPPPMMAPHPVSGCSYCNFIRDDVAFCPWCGTAKNRVPAFAAPVGPGMSIVPVSPGTLLNLHNPGLNFCNRCGRGIRSGDSNMYRGLVLCPECYDVEPMPSMPLEYELIPAQPVIPITNDRQPTAIYYG